MADKSDEPIVFIQLDRDVAGNIVPQAAGDGFAKLTRRQLEELAQTARETGSALMSKLRQFEAKPSKVGLEFGISAGGEAGIPFVTKGTLEAQFKVTLEWTLKPGE